MNSKMFQMKKISKPIISIIYFLYPKLDYFIIKTDHLIKIIDLNGSCLWLEPKGNPGELSQQERIVREKD